MTLYRRKLRMHENGRRYISFGGVTFWTVDVPGQYPQETGTHVYFETPNLQNGYFSVYDEKLFLFETPQALRKGTEFTMFATADKPALTPGELRDADE